MTWGKTPVDDDEARFNPTEPCFKELFAVQVRDPLPGQPRFLIRRDLYQSPLVSNTTRAGIILHETIYRESIEDGALDSKNARTYNYLVASIYDGAVNFPAAYEKEVLDPTRFSYKKIHPVYSVALGKLLQFRTEGFYQIPDGSFGGKLVSLNALKLPKLDLKWKGEADFDFGPSGNVNKIQLPPGSTAVAQIYTQDIQLGSDPSYGIEINVDDTNSEGAVLSSFFSGTLSAPIGFTNTTCKDFFRREKETLEMLECRNTVGPTDVILKDGTRVSTADGNTLLFKRFYDSNHQLERSLFPKSFTLAQDTDLRLSGTKRTQRFSPSGTIYLSDLDGGVESGPLTAPLPLIIGGVSTFTKNISIDDDGSTYSFFSIDFASPEKDGFPLLNTPDLDGLISGHGFCADQGFIIRMSGSLDPHTKTTIDHQTVYLSGQKTFYDYQASKPITQTDQYVDGVSQINCKGLARFKIPE